MLNLINGLSIKNRDSPLRRGDARSFEHSFLVVFIDPALLFLPYLLLFLVLVDFFELCIAFFFELEYLLLYVLFHRLDVYCPAF